MQLRFRYRGWKAWLLDQRCELRELTAALQPDELAVDVGAHKGSYLWALSRAVRQGQVFAFEPQPELAEYIREGCAQTGLANVVVENAGVSDASGTLTLAIPENRLQEASFEPRLRETHQCRTVEVPTVSLDHYFANETRRIGALKIDVEGHELSVLRGARELLKRDQPLVVCECESRHLASGNVTTTLQWFAEQGYGGHFVNEGRLVPLDDFEPARHQRSEGEQFWAQRGYCNNFVFRPQEIADTLPFDERMTIPFPQRQVLPQRRVLSTERARGRQSRAA